MKVFDYLTALLLLIPLAASCGPTSGIIAKSPNNDSLSTFTVNDETPFTVSGFHSFGGIFMPGFASTTMTCDPPYILKTIDEVQYCLIQSGVFPDFFGDHYISTSCSINGIPYTEPNQIINGIKWSLKRNGTTDIATRSEVRGNDVVLADIILTGTMAFPSDIGERFYIRCDTNAGLIFRYGYVLSDNIYSTDASIKLERTTQISIPQQPGFIRGTPNQPVSVRFPLSINDPWEHAYRLSWSVGQPCSDWEPVLRLPSGTELNPGTGDEGGVSHGDHNLTATFTPTSLGSFTCYGTVTVSED